MCTVQIFYHFDNKVYCLKYAKIWVFSAKVGITNYVSVIAKIILVIMFIIGICWELISVILAKTNTLINSAYLSFYLPNKVHCLTLIRLGVSIWPSPPSPMWFLQKCVFWRNSKTLVFVTFDIVISHVFPENAIEISRVVQKIWRFSPSILTIFIDFSNFLTFICCKETKDVSM